ncbi:MAG: lipopolysaccharide transport periplasmic protein LptA [Dokdonella sp.]
MSQSNRPLSRCMIGAVVFATLAAAPLAHALSSDREKPMNVTAAYSKITQGGDKGPGVAFLKGKVQITQGSMKANGAEATIYQHPTAAKGSDSGSSVQRVVLVGQQAHMEQLQDKGGTITADADKIDYDADTSVAVLTGNVTVVQQGSGTFNGEHMTYNTNTGEMESTDATSHKPVTMTFEAKAKTPTKDKPAADKTKDKAAKDAPTKKDGAGETP